MIAFDRTNLFEPNKHIFRKIESSLEVKIAKEEFSDNPGHRIWELYNEVKKNLISNIINLVKLGIWVAWQVVERLNIGNIGKISNLDADIDQFLSFLPEITVVNSSKKARKYISNLSFLTCSLLLDFSSLSEIFFSSIKFTQDINKNKTKQKTYTKRQNTQHPLKTNAHN